MLSCSVKASHHAKVSHGERREDGRVGYCSERDMDEEGGPRWEVRSKVSGGYCEFCESSTLEQLLDPLEIVCLVH